MRTGNTPPGAPAHAPSLPPGLPPRLLLRSASAPLAFAWAAGPDPGTDLGVPEGCGLGGAVGVALPPARGAGALGSPEPPAWRQSACAGSHPQVPHRVQHGLASDLQLAKSAS